MRWSAGRAARNRPWMAVGLVTAASLLLAATGCSDDADPNADDSASVTTTTTVDPDGTVAPSEPTAPEQTLGTVVDTVPGVGDVAAPVALDQPASFGDGVTVRVSGISAIDADASLPGERSGAALAVTLEITNRSDAAVDLGTTTVDLTTGGDRSATRITSPDEPGFTGSVESGASASARYTFLVEPAQRNDIAIKIKYSAAAPTVVIAGDASDV